LRHRVSDAPSGAPLTVILRGERMPARRTAWSDSAGAVIGPASPTTTGKIERLQQTRQEELLTTHDPFVTIEQAQAALNAWRQDYNADRLHQSLNMAFPSSRFAPATSEVIGLRIPAELIPPNPVLPADPEPEASPAPAPASGALPKAGHAVELDRVVPPSGNIWVAGQQIWLGPAMIGRTVRVWLAWTRYMSC
jgi:hypothetical protein